MIYEPDFSSDRSLIDELKRRGYSVVRSEQVCEVICEAIVSDETLQLARGDLKQAIAGQLTQQLAYELFNVAPVTTTRLPPDQRPGERHAIHVVFIKPKEKHNGGEEEANTQGKGGGQKENQQPTKGSGGRA